tara:strand:+ start:244 stop:753 length:510 start_codon:yes stop_codon:yes gene_type:complete
MNIIKIRSIWDFISALVLLCNYILIYESFEGHIELPLGTLITLSLEKLGKVITGNWYPSIFKRPDCARDCSIFNDGGFVGDKPGFPSGHVAMTSYFAYVILFKYFEVTKTNIAIATIAPIIMGFARYYKYCHNIYQIVAGWLLGIGVAYFIKYIASYKTKTNKDSIKKD